MFDIADNVLKIPFMKCVHSRNVKYFHGAVADNMLVYCHKQDPLLQERERVS